jgi:hypothetical protein
MSYQVTIASSGGDGATMGKSFIIALEGPALTWYTRLPPLFIDSWKGLRDKFLLNFQGYRLNTDALAELSPCTMPSVAFGLASYTVTTSGTHPKISKSSISCSRSTPDPKSSISAWSSLRESPRTLRRLVEPGQGLRSQTPDGTAAVSSRCTT